MPNFLEAHLFCCFSLVSAYFAFLLNKQVKRGIDVIFAEPQLHVLYIACKGL